MGKGMRAGKKKPSGGGGGGNMKSQIKQLQAMQREMEQTQDELNTREITVTAGGGAIEVTANGAKELVRLNIDREVVDPDDVEMLQDLIIAAVNEAMRQVDAMVETEMNKITGGLGIPGM